VTPSALEGRVVPVVKFNSAKQMYVAIRIKKNNAVAIYDP